MGVPSYGEIQLLSTHQEHLVLNKASLCPLLGSVLPTLIHVATELMDPHIILVQHTLTHLLPYFVFSVSMSTPVSSILL